MLIKCVEKLKGSCKFHVKQRFLTLLLNPVNIWASFHFVLKNVIHLEDFFQHLKANA